MRPLRRAAWIPLLLLFSFAFSSFSLFVDEGMERKKSQQVYKSNKEGRHFVEIFNDILYNLKVGRKGEREKGN